MTSTSTSVFDAKSYDVDPRHYFRFLQYRSETNINDALSQVGVRVLTEQAGDRPGAANIVVVLTDARSTIDRQHTQSTAAALRRAGANIFVIGIGDVDEDEAVGIAGSRANYRRVNGTDFQQAISVIDSIAQTICQPWFPA